jgi:hypothetical protein
MIGALAVPATALLAVTSPGLGPSSWHMAVHIACMGTLRAGPRGDHKSHG